MILVDGLMVDRVAVSVAVSLLIKHIDLWPPWLKHDMLLEHQQELRPVTWCTTPPTSGWTSTLPRGSTPSCLR